MKIEIIYTHDTAKKHMKRATDGSAGIDVVNCGPDIELHTHLTSMVDLGFKVHVADPAFCAILLPRSGLSTKQGVILANTVGLIDSDYQGPVMAALHKRLNAMQAGVKLGDRLDGSVKIKHGDRIAQLVIVPVMIPELVAVDEFTGGDTVRGSGGFGSSGQ